jgi:hypothetical protein
MRNTFASRIITEAADGLDDMEELRRRRSSASCQACDSTRSQCDWVANDHGGAAALAVILGARERHAVAMVE